MVAPLMALGGAASASLAAAAAQAAGGSDVTSYIQGGGSAAAVAGLVYVARLIAKGELVPRPVKETELEISAALRATLEREEAAKAQAESLAAMFKQVHEDRKRQYELQDKTLVALTQVQTEMNYWRNRRPEKP